MENEIKLIKCYEILWDIIDYYEWHHVVSKNYSKSLTTREKWLNSVVNTVPAVAPFTNMV